MCKHLMVSTPIIVVHLSVWSQLATMQHSLLSGCRVRIYGLSARGHFNGMEGTAHDYNDHKYSTHGSKSFAYHHYHTLRSTIVPRSRVLASFYSNFRRWKIKLRSSDKWLVVPEKHLEVLDISDEK